MVYKSRNKAEDCMKLLARVLKHKKVGNCYTKTKGGYKAKIGCWELDCNPVYGGCVINEMMNEGGGVTQPFGERRRKPQEFCEAIWFADKVLEYKHRKRR